VRFIKSISCKRYRKRLFDNLMIYDAKYWLFDNKFT